MRNLILIFVFYIPLYLFGQDYPANYLSKELPKKNVRMIEDIVTQDSVGVKSMHRKVTLFNQNGLKEKEFKINLRGDTLSRQLVFYPDKNTVETSFTMNGHLGHSYMIYNNKDLLIAEYYDFGIEEIDDTTKYEYNKDDLLIRKFEIGSSFGNRDTLIYKENKLMLVLSFNASNQLYDSVVYFYNKLGQLSEAIEYNRYGIIDSRHVRNYDKKGHMVKKVSTHYYHSEVVKNSTFTTLNWYYPDGIKRKAEITYLSGTEKMWVITTFFNSDGMMTKYIMDEPVKELKIVDVYTIYYY